MPKKKIEVVEENMGANSLSGQMSLFDFGIETEYVGDKTEVDSISNTVEENRTANKTTKKNKIRQVASDETVVKSVEEINVEVAVNDTRDYEGLIDQTVVIKYSGKEYKVVADYGNVLKIKDGVNSFNVARSDVEKRA